MTTKQTPSAEEDHEMQVKVLDLELGQRSHVWMSLLLSLFPTNRAGQGVSILIKAFLHNTSLWRVIFLWINESFHFTFSQDVKLKKCVDEKSLQFTVALSRFLKRKNISEFKWHMKCVSGLSSFSSQSSLSLGYRRHQDQKLYFSFHHCSAAQIFVLDFIIELWSKRSGEHVFRAFKPDHYGTSFHVLHCLTALFQICHFHRINSLTRTNRAGLLGWLLYS